MVLLGEQKLKNSVVILLVRMRLPVWCGVPADDAAEKAADVQVIQYQAGYGDRFVGAQTLPDAGIVEAFSRPPVDVPKVEEFDWQYLAESLDQFLLDFMNVEASSPEVSQVS